MKLVNYKRFRAGIFSVILILAIIIPVQAQIISIEDAEISEDFEILAEYDYTVSWESEYRNAVVTNKVVTDSNGDVIAVGTNGLNGVIVKFSGIDGSVIWDLKITESYVEALDSDFDGMPDYWESEYGLDLNYDDSQIDSDFDQLINLQELFYRTNPTDDDSDNDGLRDSEEVLPGEDGYITNPNDADSDNDQFTDGEEKLMETNPNDIYELPCPYDIVKSINNKINFQNDILLNFMDVAVDSNDNIIVIGIAIFEPYSENPYSDVYIVKYDSGGNKLWDKIVDEGRIEYGMGITCDSDDNIFITGNSISLIPIPHLKGWVFKLGKNYGVTHWKKASDIETIPQPFYMDLDTNSHDDVYSGGAFLDIEWGNQDILSSVMIITKRDGSTGTKLAQTEIIEAGYDSDLWGIKIDNDDSIFAAGDIYNPVHGELIKLNSDLTTIFWKLTDFIELNGNCLVDIDLMSNGDAVVIAEDWGLDFTTWIIDGDTGAAFLLEIKEGGGVDEYGYPIYAWFLAGSGGVNVDKDGNIIVTGKRIYTHPIEQEYSYTMKYDIVTGSSWYCFSESQYYEEISQGYLGPKQS